MERRWKLSFKALACRTHNVFFTRHEKVIPLFFVIELFETLFGDQYGMRS